jgi:hypothetical protein
LRLAFYQAGSVARTTDPQLAAFYYRLMTEHGHCHTQANLSGGTRTILGKSSRSHQQEGKSAGGTIWTGLD